MSNPFKTGKVKIKPKPKFKVKSKGTNGGNPFRVTKKPIELAQEARKESLDRKRASEADLVTSAVADPDVHEEHKRVLIYVQRQLDNWAKRSDFHRENTEREMFKKTRADRLRRAGYEKIGV